jgi:transposase-like protein
MNLIDVTQQFKSDDDCLAYLESMRWPDGIRCPLCGCDKISKIQRTNVILKGEKKGQIGKNKRTRIYQCLEPTCKQQFSATSGTIFNDSHLPLTKWFMAMAIIVDAKKSISANQLKQHLGIGSYKTAWYMAHRIRKAMVNDEPAKMDGVIEIDETYVGGQNKGREYKNDWNHMGYRGRSTKSKEIVLALRQREGAVKMFHIPNVKADTIRAIVEQHVCDSVEVLLTDDFRSYPIALKKYSDRHLTINHSARQYVTGCNGEIHTNTVESTFSLFKRGIIGSWHKISAKHMHRYLAEFETRFNARKAKDRFEPTLRRMLGIDPMPYAELIAE